MRTPYQWDATKNAGFSDGKPWIKVNPRYTEINLEADRKSEDSIFAYYQALTRLRLENPAIVEGDLRFLLEGHPEILLYLRECEKQTILVVANYSKNTVEFDIPDEVKNGKWRRLLTNQKNTVPSLYADRALLPWESEVYELVK